MTYQVLARKWRPKNFAEMAGQTHVLQTLTHALEQQRLHHAYLFTGTRGVGKTTVARILARCLNCEQGVTATPCGSCSACQEITEGRFIDLIEVDAGSRTRVEDTRELLENVQYAPTRGRFKVYLIDEVHMLSTHSFNALLKTLEEPPPHVKFLLATTDPQKLPVTVLSRCLQFHLKNLAPGQIVQYLQSVLTAEQIAFEEDALWQLARAANGSMRDALTLLDQSISFGAGKVTAEAVTGLLGTPDHRLVFELATRLAERDAAGLLQSVATAAENNPDFSRLLEQLLSLFHRLAVAQMLPEAVDNSEGDREQVVALAARLTPEDVQLYYQVCQQTLQEMASTPDRRISFEMALLRMLAFSPDMFLAGKALTASADQAARTPVDNGAEQPAGISEPVAAAVTNNAVTHVPVSDSGSSTRNVADGNEKKKPLSATDTATPDVAPAQSVQAHRALPTDRAPVTEPVPGPVSASSVPEATPATIPNRGAASDTSAAPAPATAAVPESGPAAQLKPGADSASASARTGRAESTPPVTVDTPPVQSAQLQQPAALGQDRDWYALVAATTLHGISGNILHNCVPEFWSDTELQLVLDQSHSALYNPDHDREIAEALSASLQQDVTVSIRVGALDQESPAAKRRREKQAAIEAAHQRFNTDPGVQALVDTFAAEVDADSLVIHHSV